MFQCAWRPRLSNCRWLPLPALVLCSLLSYGLHYQFKYSQESSEEDYALGVSRMIASTTGVTGAEKTKLATAQTELLRQNVPQIQAQKFKIVRENDRHPEIPGSKLKPGEEVRAFRRRWDCMTSRETSHWVLDSTPRMLPWPMTKHRGYCGIREGYLGPGANSAVKAGEYTKEHWPVADSLKYVWRTKGDPRDTCGVPGGNATAAPDLVSLDAKGFCSALRRTKGSLFIVGDSLSDNFFSSVLSQMSLSGIPILQRLPSPACRGLAVDVYKHSALGSSPPTGVLCQHYFICGNSWHTGALQMHFARSLHLGRLHPNSSVETALFPATAGVPELAWGEEMVRYKATVVILNRGAHFLSNEDGFRLQLKYTLHELRRMVPKALIVYRSTPAGHPNCTAYKRPIDVPIVEAHWPFNWDKFEEQNAYAREVVESIGGVFLDVSPMTSLRPDWHVIGPQKDCLHYCKPGLVDDWVKLFARMVTELV